MNDAVFFRTADYTKNENLVMDDSTIYEVDPKCLADSSEQNRRSEENRQSEENTMEDLGQEFVCGIDVECMRQERKSISFTRWIFVILMICFCKSH